MNNPRRKFIITAGLAAGTMAGTGLQALAATTLGSDPGKQEVKNFLSKYGTPREARTRSNTVAFEVKMHSHEAFTKAFLGEHPVPIQGVFADGNTLRFKHNGTSFLVTNIA